MSTATPKAETRLSEEVERGIQEMQSAKMKIEQAYQAWFRRLDEKRAGGMETALALKGRVHEIEDSIRDFTRLASAMCHDVEAIEEQRRG